MAVLETLQKVFTKEEVSKEAFKRDGYMLLRFLSMKLEYLKSINRVQKYQGVLGHRLMSLLQHLFGEADKAPFLDYVKKEEKPYQILNKNSVNVLKRLFLVSEKRLEEYLPNLWVSDDEIKETWGVN